jgi:hypothetical protein
LQDLQAGQDLQYVIYGDSAYIVVVDTHIRARYDNRPNTARQTLENLSMSSCREVIEWDYGDVGVMWGLVDYKKVLKMRKMPVAKMYLTAMILRNAHNTMNGSNTALYFELQPPTFEVWTAVGPRE